MAKHPIAALKTGIKSLWSVIAAHPIIATVAAVSALCIGINKVAGAAKEASKVADELKAKSMEEANSAREEVNTLDGLISKHKELADCICVDRQTPFH